MEKKNLFLIAVLLLITLKASSQVSPSTSADYIDILASEAQREFNVLKNEKTPAHYLDYRVEEKHTWNINSFLGFTTRRDSTHDSYVKNTIRVGTPEFDNTHTIKGKKTSIAGFGLTRFPIENGEEAIRQALWKITEKNYSKAKSEYNFKKSKIKVEGENTTLDFAPASKVNHVAPRLNTQISEETLNKIEDMLKEASSVFTVDPDIMSGEVRFNYSVVRKYFVSSEGHKIVQNFPMARITINGTVRSKDGNQMKLYKSIDAFEIQGLPSKEEIVTEVKALTDKLIELKSAPIVNPYTGPAILSASAAGVFFHEIFGHRIEGHRLKDDSNAQTFKSKVGKQVLPSTFSVTFDPSVKVYNGFDLNGHYAYDDQGVKGGKVTIVEKGILHDFLMCRTPIENFEQSNGHGRGDIFHSTVSRQSNMFITTSKPYSEKDLRKKLIKECKKQKLEYGYYFKEVTGGFTTTGRYRPNAFNVTPTEVYRIYVDGRPDELVRGVDLIGTPLSMFSTIVAAGKNESLFNGFCGAESGRVPVATISPAILVKKVETQKKQQKFSTGTILQSPTPSPQR